MLSSTVVMPTCLRTNFFPYNLSQPPKIRSFIDSVTAVPLENIEGPLKGFVWEFDKVTFFTFHVIKFWLLCCSLIYVYLGGAGRFPSLGGSF